MAMLPQFNPGPIRHAFQQTLPLLDLLPDVFVFAKDRHHRFVLANAAEWAMHGCSSEAGMLGRTDHDFHPPALARQYVAEDRQVMDSGQPILHQVWLVPDASGSPFWYVCSKLPLLDPLGELLGIAGVMRPYERAGTAPEEYRRLLPAVDFARRHYGESLGVPELARQAGLSSSQFQREFRRVFGRSPAAYLLEVRIQAARHLLEHSSQALSGIALDCGFHDQSHFTKRFKAATGLLPRAYRLRFSAKARTQVPWTARK
jgi:AraC-like DNA-binding protein